MTQTNPLIEMNRCGTSVWLDNINRGLIESGELQRLVREDGLSGLTSNPTIFQKAIAGSKDYDTYFQDLLVQGLDTNAIYEALAIRDIAESADIFRPIYDQSKGADGYVSLEVSPLLAYDTGETIEEARRLWKKVNRKNLLVKIPATREGLAAIEEVIYQGMNVNVTLIFSIERYVEVTLAYRKGLERRIKEKKPVSGIASVASFFVSRMDTLVDKIIDEKLTGEQDREKRGKLEGLRSLTAVANAKTAYAEFEKIFLARPFRELKNAGANVQKVLWASTSTKNPRLSDVMYVEPLIGPYTINTLPPATVDAVRDHARAEETIKQNQSEAFQILKTMNTAGINYKEVTKTLEDAGVEAFRKSFEDLLGSIHQKRKVLAESKSR